MGENLLFLVVFLAMLGLSGCRLVDGGVDSTDPMPPITLEKKIAQMLMVGFRGTTLDESNYIVRDIRDYGLGGVILFDKDVLSGKVGRNITSPAQLKSLTASLQAISATPLFISVDQEGGKVARLKESYGFAPTVTAQYLGTMNDLALTRKYADSIAQTLAENGITMNFAPVVDLNTNPLNPVIGKLERSFSADPGIVVAHSREFIAAHEKAGIATCLKHFPGHGSSTTDSHLGFTDVTLTWNEKELEPYRQLISSGTCRMVMTAHIFNGKLDPNLPATLSQLTITDILRKKLGFNGVIVSDDTQMKSLSQFYDFDTVIEKSILAGVDIILVPNNNAYDPDVTPNTIEKVAKLVRSGTIPEARIDESYRRIMELKNLISVRR